MVVAVVVVVVVVVVGVDGGGVLTLRFFQDFSSSPHGRNTARDDRLLPAPACRKIIQKDLGCAGWPSRPLLGTPRLLGAPRRRRPPELAAPKGRALDPAPHRRGKPGPSMPPSSPRPPLRDMEPGRGTRSLEFGAGWMQLDVVWREGGAESDLSLAGEALLRNGVR